MRDSPRYLRNSAAKRCALCDGKFGLIRYHSWRTALCSKKCVARFKARQEATADGYAGFKLPGLQLHNREEEPEPSVSSLMPASVKEEPV